MRFCIVPLHRQLLLDGPGRRPHRRVRDRDRVLHRVRIHPREPFDELQVLGGAAERELRREIRGLDDQRIALEAAARVAVAEADVARRMAPAQIDHALVALALPGVDADRDGVRPLHDAAEPVEVRRRSPHAAVAQALILRAVVTVHAPRVVERGHFGEARRGRPVLSRRCSPAT